MKKRIAIIIALIASLLVAGYLSYVAGMLTIVKIISDGVKTQGQVEFSTGEYFDDIHFVATTKIE